MKILIVINGSPSDQQTIDFGAQFARRTKTPSTVFLFTRQRKGNDSAALQKYLGIALNAINIQGTIAKMSTGQPAVEIIKEIQNTGVDLVVIGEWYRNSLARFFSKPISVQVAELADCPILVVKGKAKPVRRILLCDSGAGLSHVLNRFTVQLADILDGEEEVTILHVMSQMSAGPRVLGKELRANAMQLIEENSLEGELLEQDVQELSRPGIRAEPKVRHGLVVDEILAESRSGNYDLLVIGAHNVQNLPPYLLENIAQEILLRSDRPVLVVC